MPVTATILAGVVETSEEYAVRRILWAADLFLEEGLLPQSWQLISRANVYRFRGRANIKVVIETALQKLASTLWIEYGMRAAS
jgi:N-acyl-L-homoserine lactone synthetase